MLVAPHCVGRSGALPDGIMGPLEDKPDVQLWMLFLHQDVLCAVAGLELALGLHKDAIRQLEVWCVLPGRFGDDEGYRGLLELDADPEVLQDHRIL